MKAQGKYIQLLEGELESYKALLGQARKDIEYYRAKVERLELSLRDAGVVTAAPPLLSTERPENVVSKLERLPSGKMPFSEIKRRWNAMSDAEQQKAIVDGWDLDAQIQKEKEEANAG